MTALPGAACNIPTVRDAWQKWRTILLATTDTAAPRLYRYVMTASICSVRLSCEMQDLPPQADLFAAHGVSSHTDRDNQTPS